MVIHSRSRSSALVLAVGAIILSATCTCSFVLSPGRLPRSNRLFVSSSTTIENDYESTISSSLHMSRASQEQWNPASSTPQLLAAIWDMVIKAEEMGRDSEMTMLFPNMGNKLGNVVYMSRLMNHLDNCKDVCDEFGISTILVPKQSEGKTVGFIVKSYSDPVSWGRGCDEVDDTGGYKFNNDEYWNDDSTFELDPALFDDEEDEDSSGMSSQEQQLPDDKGVSDESMVSVTKGWVGTMMSNMGICPFTSGPEMAGLPLGQVYYTVDRVSKVEHVYASYWKELVRLEQSNERDLSTTLLILPEFSLHNVELFENLSTTLTQPLEPLQLEDLTQLVFFHPRWTFRDGGDRVGDSGTTAANYARRSPWPMINLLRTTQVRAAQKGIPTGLVYTQNEKTLSAVGTKELEGMLQSRNWDNLSDTKVNRREHDALSLAIDMQEVGEDGSKVDAVVQNSIGQGLDQNAAVNKVDSSKIEGGDLVNVIKQALEKRIETGVPLNGAETSATLMASDFLLEELDNIARS